MGDLATDLVSSLSQSSIPDLETVDQLLAAHLGQLKQEHIDDECESTAALVDEMTGEDMDPEAMDSHPGAHINPWAASDSFLLEDEEETIDSLDGPVSNPYEGWTTWDPTLPLYGPSFIDTVPPFSPGQSTFHNGMVGTAFSVPLPDFHSESGHYIFQPLQWPQSAAFSYPYISTHAGDSPMVPDHRSRRTLEDFLLTWRHMRFAHAPRETKCSTATCPEGDCKGACISPSVALSEIRPSDCLRYDCDQQGINWASLGTTREFACNVRPLVVSPQLGRCGSDERLRMDSSGRPVEDETFFKWRRTLRRHIPFVQHFQLRNMIAVTGPDHIYYAAQQNLEARVMHAESPEKATCIMDLSAARGPHGRFATTCLTASKDVLIAGSYDGSYAYKYLGTAPEHTYMTGQVANTLNGITNHIHTFADRRNSSTQAAFCSNDSTLRTLDCATNRFTNEFSYPFMINCAATSPDGQLRVIVGDAQYAPGPSTSLSHSVAKSYVTRTDTGTPVHTMTHHGSEDAFACAWADDGITFATAAQDKMTLVYDARRWDAPIARIRSNMSDPRILAFSPVGSGRRSLFIAEADDYVTVVDARTFATSQVLTSFGSLAGMALTPDGQNLVMANQDRQVGGLLEYEKCDGVDGWGRDQKWDWLDEEDVDRHRSVTRGWRARRDCGVAEDVVV